MLNGMRVVDFSNYLPGPYATMRLAELGAEIIKVESPRGDPARELDVKLDGTGVVFLANNKCKKSVTLDLKNFKDQQLAKRLIASADAVLESFRPGVMKKLGLDYETVRPLNPKLVYCSLTGYGDNGKYHQHGSHDLNYMAISGMLAQLKDRSGKPIHPSQTIADFVGGIAASERILAGLVARGISGEGSYHCISIADVMTSMMGNHFIMNQVTGAINGVDILSGSIINYAIYETMDHRYIALGALEKKFWENFCEAIEKREWAVNYYHQTNSDIYQEVKTVFKSKSFQQWIEFSEKVDCCMTPVLEVDELSNFSYFTNRDIIKNENDILLPKLHSDRYDASQCAPPKLGENTNEILSSLSQGK